jgi:tetratricopeptide (TPR) repeat protein
MKRTFFITAALLLISSLTAFSQSKEEAIKLFNEALEIAKANNFDGAISKMNACVDMCEKLGSDGADTKAEAVKRLPKFYFQKAAGILKEKNLDRAIIAFEETKRIAAKYGDKEIEKKAGELMPQLHYNKGNELFKAGDNTGALAQYEIAINLDANYAKAYYGKGLVFKKLDDVEKMLEAMDKAIEVASQRKDDATLRSAESTARDILVFKGAKATESKQYGEAVRLLKRALQYDQNFADTYFRLAEAYNKQALFKDAIEAGNKALELEKGGKTQSAKIYFELGEAYKGLGNFERACEAYKNSAFGPFLQSANHMIEHELKCAKTPGQ